MSITVTDIQGSAGVAGFVRSTLEQGLSVGRTLCDCLSGSPSIAAITDSPELQSRLRRPEAGGLIGKAVAPSELGSSVVGRWPRSLVVVEMPLARPGDPSVEAAHEIARVCADEVYAVARAGDGTQAVTRVLEATDPAFGFVASILSDGPEAAGQLQASDWLTSRQLQAVLVGAYDGEGYLLLQGSDFDV